MKDITGLRVGRLTVTSETQSRSKTKHYKCICECGNERFYTKQALLKGDMRSCGCYKAENKGKSHKNWKGVGDISSSFLCRIKATANRRKIEFNLSLKYLSDLYENADKKCALSGLEIDFPKTWKEAHEFKYTASLDRIDSSRGYVEGNVQWVHKDVNMMKQQFDQKHFISLCSEIVRNQKLCKIS